MKFFHLSDLHIGLKLYNRDLYEDQRYILDQIIGLAMREQPDAMVIAGDIYNKAIPSAEAVEVFDWFVSRVQECLPHMVLMMISGNHDSAPRVNVFRQVLRRQQIHMIGMPPLLPEEHIEKVSLQDAHGAVHFYLLPFVKPSMVKLIVGADDKGNNLSYEDTVRKLLQRESIVSQERNVLVSHQFYLPVGEETDSVERMDSEVRTVGNIDSIRADVLAPFDYAALGHIHKPMKVGSETRRYCGTPIACSVSEAGQEKSVILVELGQKGTITTKTLPLTPLHQVRVLTGTLEQLLGQACEDYVTAVLTEERELNVPDMQDRLRKAFPNLLEIRREQQRKADYQAQYRHAAALDTFELCKAFLSDLKQDEQALLQEIIQTVEA